MSGKYGKAGRSNNMNKIKGDQNEIFCTKTRQWSELDQILIREVILRPVSYTHLDVYKRQL